VSMRFLWTSGPKQRNNAIKFFAMIFTLTTFILWTGVGFGIAKWTIPELTSELLGIFWGGYILNSRGKDWLEGKKDTAPGGGE